uniref:Cleavage stimulation factor 50 kDa subunit n=1 Tax=Trichuris muris TaxID=70415 RepID=A0A5S6QNH1_TRIMR
MYYCSNVAFGCRCFAVFFVDCNRRDYAPRLTIVGMDKNMHNNLYRLIISQLYYDGYSQMASSLSKVVNEDRPCPPSNKLLRCVTTAYQAENDQQEKGRTKNANEWHTSCLDMDFDADLLPSSPEPALYETIFITAHKDVCRACAFNIDGSLVATGSGDASIKIVDIDRVLSKEHMFSDVEVTQANAEFHPVIRTLYDHVDQVNCLAFHPREQILASGSNDCTLKFFDFAKSSVKRAFKTILEVEPVRCMAFDPLGDCILVGTEHSTLRLYVVETLQCFVSPVPADQHTGALTDIQYTHTGRNFASASKDGSIKLWDGVSCRCVNTFQRAHDGAEVCSAVFSKNGKYILSCGKDGVVKLWELCTNRCLMAYTCLGASGQSRNRIQAAFNQNEDYVLFPEENSGCLYSWVSRTCERKRILPLGHTAPVRAFAHSPVQPAFITCSDDYRARYWYRKAVTD